MLKLPNAGEREEGGGGTDHQADHRGQSDSCPGDGLGASGVAGADMGADKDDERLADGEDERDLREFEVDFDSRSRRARPQGPRAAKYDAIAAVGREDNGSKPLEGRP